MIACRAMIDELDLLDWKRNVLSMYAAVRALPDGASDAERAAAAAAFRAGREALIAGHPQSPLDASGRAAFRGLRHFPFDPAMRFVCPVEPAPSDELLELPASHDEGMRFRRIGRVRVVLSGEIVTLAVYWIAAYGGGLFLPFRDSTSGSETYGAGRYLWDSVKGADLGSSGRSIVVDFNYAYNPSCAYDPRWACPLAPSDNRIAVPVRAGELVYDPTH